MGTYNTGLDSSLVGNDHGEVIDPVPDDDDEAWVPIVIMVVIITTLGVPPTLRRIGTVVCVH